MSSTRARASPSRPTRCGRSRAELHLGRNLAAVVGRRKLSPFGYRGLGRAAAFGKGRAITELYGVPFTGGVAWLLRLVFFLRFMPTKGKAVDVLRSLARRA